MAQKLVLIGASTGGPGHIKKLLKDINLNANSIEITNSNDEIYHNEVSKKSKIGLISIGEHLKNIKDDLKRIG